MLSILLKNPNEIMLEIRDRFRKRRLLIGYTQEALAERSGVSFGSVKRFEKTGEISMKNLLRISIVLDCIKDFGQLGAETPTAGSLDEILVERTTVTPKRGHKK